MSNPSLTGYAAECFWPDVREDDLDELDRRIEASVEAVAGGGDPVTYLGRLLVIDDEVVLVLFEGSVATVRRVAEQAEVPFGRLLHAAHVPSRRPQPPMEELK